MILTSGWPCSFARKGCEGGEHRTRRLSSPPSRLRGEAAIRARSKRFYHSSLVPVPMRLINGSRPKPARGRTSESSHDHESDTLLLRRSPAARARLQSMAARSSIQSIACGQCVSHGLCHGKLLRAAVGCPAHKRLLLADPCEIGTALTVTEAFYGSTVSPRIPTITCCLPHVGSRVSSARSWCRPRRRITGRKRGTPHTQGAGA